MPWTPISLRAGRRSRDRRANSLACPRVLVVFRLWSESEIRFDIDLRELQGQQGVDTLCAFLQAIGSRLGKPVLMTPEGGSQEHPVLGYDPALGKVTVR